MRSFARPSPEYDYDHNREKRRLRRHRDTAEGRFIPERTDGHVLLATWNIANLGVHKRRERDLKVIAEILSWFELIAVQEVADDLDDFHGVMAALGRDFAYVVSDKGGNQERAAYIYDTRRVGLQAKIGEVALTETERGKVALQGVDLPFEGFNRNPYIGSFEIEGATLVLVNAHLFFGKTTTRAERRRALNKRQLEAYATGRWCDLRRRSDHRFSPHIIALGDFNLPTMDDGDPVMVALKSRGLECPEPETHIPGTNLTGDRRYDQITFVPGLRRNVERLGVFDFDAVVFKDIWDPQRPAFWRARAKYYISDHRPLWLQLRLPSEA